MLRLFTFIFSLSFFLTSGSFAKGWPDFPFPDKAKISIVAENMIVNGVSMQAWELKSKESLEETLGFYRQEWQSNDPNNPGYVEDALANWKIISHKEGDYFFTAKLEGNKAGCRGYLGLTLLPDDDARLPKLGADFPRLNGTTVVQDIRSTDGGKKSQTLVMFNKASVQENKEFLTEYYAQDGWVTQSPANVPALLMQRGGEELNVTFSRSQGNTYMTAVKVGH